MVFDVNLENLYNSVSATPPQTGLAQTLAKFSGSDEMKLLVQILDGIKALSRGMHNSEANSELLATLPIGGATDASLAVYYRLEWGNLLLFIRDIVCGLLDGPSMLTYNTAVKIYLGMLVKIFGDNGGATSEIVLLALMTLLNSLSDVARRRIYAVLRPFLDTVVRPEASGPYTQKDQLELQATVDKLYWNFRHTIAKIW